MSNCMRFSPRYLVDYPQSWKRAFVMPSTSPRERRRPPIPRGAHQESSGALHPRPQDRTMFRMQLKPLFDTLERFMNGLTGHETITLASLLERYEATESLFGGSIEARFLALRAQYKDDLEKAIVFVLSHIKVQSKLKLVLA